LTDSQADQTTPLGHTVWLTRERCAAALVAIVAFCIALDLFFFTGYYASDDRAYFNAATRVAEDGFIGEPLLAHTRLTMLGWNLLMGGLCRFNVQAMAASYIFFHVWLILLTYALAVKLGDRVAGVIAAYGTATLPLFIVFSTGIYPIVA
jgi:hypothetical protein